MKSAAFQHLLNHYRSNKQSLIAQAQISVSNGSVQEFDNLLKLAKYSGALDCLYWQALGNDLTNLAKGIRRTLDKARVFHGFEAL